MDEIPKTLDVQIASSGDVLDYVKRVKPALEAKFEEIDRKYERRLLALAALDSGDKSETTNFPSHSPLQKKMICAAIEKRMDELARQYADTHDQEVKIELEELSCWLAEITKS